MVGEGVRRDREIVREFMIDMYTVQFSHSVVSDSL